MTPTRKESSAPPAMVERYCWGQCHVFAVALHRMFGWRLHVVMDQDERHWEDPSDSYNWIPAVCHVFAVDDLDRAWDVRGIRPMNDVAAYMHSWVQIGDYDSDRCDDEDALRMYVGCWGEDDDGNEIDRPLAEYDDADVEEAMGVAREVFVGWPEFGAAPEAKPVRERNSSPGFSL